MLVTELGMDVFIQPTIKVLVPISIIALQLFRESYMGFLSSTTMDVKPLQLAKAPPSMLVTELGIVTEVRPLQP